MNIKNYTTEVPAARSIEYIEKLLIECGARNIMKEYGDDHRCKVISFLMEIKMPDSPVPSKVPFKLSANPQKVFHWLRRKKPNSQTKTLTDQAERIAWKQQYELLHLQMGMIEMDQMEPLEMLLPYVFDIANNETFYEKVKSGQYKALLPNSN